MSISQYTYCVFVCVFVGHETRKRTVRGKEVDLRKWSLCNGISEAVLTRGRKQPVERHGGEQEERRTNVNKHTNGTCI